MFISREPVTGRIAMLDHARGLAISLMVFGHCYRGLSGAGLIPPDSVLPAVDYVIYTFHMPVFFLISGVLAGRPQRAGARATWLGRAEAILWPYMLWMTVQAAVLFACADLTNEGAITIDIGTFLWRPLSPFWFLYALFLAQLFLLATASLPRWGRVALAAAVFAAGRLFPVHSIADDVSWGVLYVAVGAAASDTLRSARFAAFAARPTTILLGWGGTIGAALLCLHAGLPNEAALPAALLGCLALLGTAAALARASAASGTLWPLGFLGQISLTVLVTHLYGTAGARIVLMHVFHLQSMALHLLVGVAAGLAVPVMLQLVFTRLGLLRAAGLPRLSRPARLHAAAISTSTG